LDWDWRLVEAISRTKHWLSVRRSCCLVASATAHSDLFSAGALVAALLLGRFPVMGLNEEALQAAWQRFDPEELRQQRPDIGLEWMECLLQLLQLEPSRRPGSAREAARLFTQAVKVVVPAPTLSTPAQESLAASAQAEPEAWRQEHSSRRRRGSRLGSLFKWGILLSALLAGAVTWLVQHRDPTWPPQVNGALDEIEAVWHKAVKSTEEVLQKRR